MNEPLFCECLYAIEFNKPRRKFCFMPCFEQDALMAKIKDEKEAIADDINWGLLRMLCGAQNEDNIYKTIWVYENWEENLKMVHYDVILQSIRLDESFIQKHNRFIADFIKRIDENVTFDKLVVEYRYQTLKATAIDLNVIP